MRRAHQLLQHRGYQLRSSYGDVTVPPRLLTRGIPPWENLAMAEASDKHRIRNPETDVKGLPGRRTEPSPPIPVLQGGGVYTTPKCSCTQ